MSIINITKAIIPAAGLGTRWLPLSKAVPKEMVPLLNKPAIQYIVEEGIESGIHDFCIITNNNKKPIQDHFTYNKKLEESLEKKNLLGLLQDVNAIIDNARFNYIIQEQPRGLGDAILLARKAIGNNYFGIFLPDEIMENNVPAMAQLISVAQKCNANVVGVQKVKKEYVSSYGIVAIEKRVGNNVYEISHVIEKPSPENAPSNFAIIGRYIFSPQLFSALAVTKPGPNKEIQLTDAIEYMLQKGEKVVAYEVQAKRFDVGSLPGWLKANYYFAHKNPRYSSYLP